MKSTDYRTNFSIHLYYTILHVDELNFQAYIKKVKFYSFFLNSKLQKITFAVGVRSKIQLFNLIRVHVFFSF